MFGKFREIVERERDGKRCEKSPGPRTPLIGLGCCLRCAYLWWYDGCSSERCTYDGTQHVRTSTCQASLVHRGFFWTEKCETTGRSIFVHRGYSNARRSSVYARRRFAPSSQTTPSSSKTRNFRIWDLFLMFFISTLRWDRTLQLLFRLLANFDSILKVISLTG